MELEKIPRREEVLIVAEAQQRLDRVIIAEHSIAAWRLFPRSCTLRGPCG